MRKLKAIPYLSIGVQILSDELIPKSILPLSLDYLDIPSYRVTRVVKSFKKIQKQKLY